MIWCEMVSIEVMGTTVDFDWEFEIDEDNFLEHAVEGGHITDEYLEAEMSNEHKEQMAQEYINGLDEEEFLLLCREKIPTIGE